MTAITAQPTAFATPRTRLRLTVRGRRLLALAAALPVVVALAWAVLGGGSALASFETGAPTASFETVTVSTGDTLWSIAEEIAPRADPRDVVDALASLNAVGDAALQVGQKLAVPARYASAP